ncbi:MAG: bifunctional (p)ppGpp synthetase/guanosine-3',5'-bis(diphosphate) 3'-pyrophosphohydrolase [Bacilli bacterium]|jgi:GTP pyrophosphokinase|nr:bifunctional (p)ppGpp synthetase/guanosine-3',5'-bis(diphosphate) 3'-pyrophosphohydrolase [Bacilli bacterium]
MVINNQIVTFPELKEAYSKYINNPDDLARIEKAYNFASLKHEGQFRKSGDPYITHLLGVGMILATLQTSPNTIIAGLLHDTIEDTGTTKEEIALQFGDEVAFLVESLTKITRLSDFHNSDFQAEDHRKIFLAMAADIRVIIIKLADRLHNMRTLQFQPEEKQKRIAQETLDVYVPIAHRLGLNSIMSELQDLSLYYSQREVFSSIEEKLNESNKDLNDSLMRIKTKLTALLTKAGIPFEISSRVKSIYSIYKKMYLKNYKFEDIYDILALRIITKTETNCYEILGYIHSAFTPVPGRFKDYIAMPKPNMYQSLHTTILSGDGHVFEIQIRTQEMDETAEEGVAAHWRYKEGTHYDPKKEQHDIEEQLHWFKDFVNLANQDKDEVNAKEYESQLRQDIFEANVYVFTPKGKVIDLPAGATPIDFAYKIHTDLGDTLSGARVNGKLVPLSTKLKTGDMVEIETKNGSSPNSEWLNIAVSSFAKAHIRKYLAKQNAEYIRSDQIEKGKASMRDSLRERKVTGSIEKMIDQKLLDNFRCADSDELYIKICNRNLMPQQIIEYLDIAHPSSSPEMIASDTKKALQNKPAPSVKDAVLLANGDSAMITLANCCTPLPGDPIVGYVSKGRGIKVHRANCPNILSEQARLIQVKWNPEMDKSVKYPVDFFVESFDRAGLLVDIMNTITHQGDLVTSIKAQYKASHGVTTVAITAMVEDASALDNLFQALMGVKSVYSVRRALH